MKKLLLLVLFIPIISFGQSFNQYSASGNFMINNHPELKIYKNGKLISEKKIAKDLYSYKFYYDDGTLMSEWEISTEGHLTSAKIYNYTSYESFTPSSIKTLNVKFNSTAEMEKLTSSDKEYGELDVVEYDKSTEIKSLYFEKNMLLEYQKWEKHILENYTYLLRDKLDWADELSSFERKNLTTRLHNIEFRKYLDLISSLNKLEPWSPADVFSSVENYFKLLDLETNTSTMLSKQALKVILVDLNELILKINKNDTENLQTAYSLRAWVRFYSILLHNNLTQYELDEVLLTPSSSNHFWIRSLMFLALGDNERFFKEQAKIRVTKNSDFKNVGFIKDYKNYISESKKSIEDLKKITEINPNFESVYYNLSFCYLRIMDYENSMKYLNISIKNNSMNDDAYFNRASLYLYFEDFDLALLDLNKAIEINPNNADMYTKKGNIKIKEKKYTEAVQLYTKALEVNSLSKTSSFSRKFRPAEWVLEETLNNRAIAYFSLKLYDKACNDAFEANKLGADNDALIQAMDCQN